jgi:hypothetical protein
LIFVDSDVFVIDLRYPRDPRFRINAEFLARVKAGDRAVTSLVNLLEVCGILSFNLNPQQVRELFHYLPRRYGIRVVPRPERAAAVAPFPPREVLDVMVRRASFGDALIICALNKLRLPVSHLVSWNARHFAPHLSIPALTPAEVLEQSLL